MVMWIVLSVGNNLAWSADYRWPVERVIDGDTIRVDASTDFPPELAGISVRLRGVDTPAIDGWAKCEAERQAGQAATRFTTTTLGRASRVVTRDPEWGKWGGRVIADMIVDGRSLAGALIAAGHGRFYDGARRRAWCAEP